MHKQLDVETQPRVGSGLGLILALTIFVSAFLLFQVQPLISKFILPWFGGSPAVWTTAMLFFQCVLFAGYAYSHFTSTYLGLQRQTQLHVVLLAVASILAWFVIPREFLKPTGLEDPTFKILTLLGLCVGLPYFMLSTTGPLIQAWYSRAYPGQSPYRLFALSNFGSLLALLSFPFLFEPHLILPTMGYFWMIGFWVFASICTFSAFQVLRLHLVHSQQTNRTDSIRENIPPSTWQMAAWIILPAMASLMFIATSNHVCHNVAPTPFLWIVPLALYLLTFIICFDHERWYKRGFFALLTISMIVLLVSYDMLEEWCWDTFTYTSVSESVKGWFKQGSRDSLFHLEIGLTYAQQTAFYFATMFLCCLVCHGELVKLRPHSHDYLTKYYLMISAGGALGGLFISIIATNFFNDYHEWPMGLVSCFLIASGVLWSIAFPRAQKTETTLPALTPAKLTVMSAIVVGAVYLGWVLDPLSGTRSKSDDTSSTTVLYKARNFYGTVTVYETKFHGEVTAKENGGVARKPGWDDNRSFRSGSILHGQQMMDTERRKTPIAYYHSSSGSGQTVNYVLHSNPDKPIKFAVVGLGAGSLAAFARGPEGTRPADVCVTYEINPEVEKIARQFFWYLPDYEQRTGQKCEVRLGDARLTMEREEPQEYDIIFLDAFSGDSVPAHLLTEEAFKIYMKHLKKNPDGTIAGHIVLNITNSYLNLYPVVKNAAEQVTKMKYTSVYRESNRAVYAQRTHYFIMSNDAGLLAAVPKLTRQRYETLLDDQGQPLKDENGVIQRKAIGDYDPLNYDWPDIPLWTDHYSNLFQILLKE